MDNGSDEAAFRNELLQIAITTLSSKLVYHEKEYFAGLAVDAVLRLTSFFRLFGRHRRRQRVSRGLAEARVDGQHRCPTEPSHASVTDPRAVANLRLFLFTRLTR